MKKSMTYAALASLALGLGACTDEAIENIGKGQPIEVSFSVSLPAEMQSRAVTTGNGESANRLTWAVYVAGQTEAKAKGVVENAFTALQAAPISVTLVEGEKYDIVFWADAGSDSPYTFSENGKSISADYASVACNSENLDAFYYGQANFLCTGSDVPVQLTRPFAQLNFGTNDIPAAHDSDVQTSVKIDVPNTLNLVTGAVSNSTSTTFNLADATISGDYPVDGGYKYISMVYVLADARQLVDIDFTIKLGTESTVERQYGLVPIQRNFRTNIYGSLLSAPTNFNVSIVPGWNVSAPWDGVTVTQPQSTVAGGKTTYGITSPAELAWLSANPSAITSDTEIVLTTNIDMGGHTWRPLGNISRSGSDLTGAFTGTFDGKGFTIMNFVSSSTADNNGVGLISVANNAVIKDVNIQGATLSTGDFAGAVVGCLKGECQVSGCTVSNVNITGTGSGAIAGIVGRAYGSTQTISDCHVLSGTISGTTKVGGVVGINNGTSTVISNCSNAATITGTVAGAGGIMAYAGCPATITNCTNTGVVTATGAAGGTGYAGGILGYINGTPAIEISSCENTATIKGEIVGGIFGATGQYGGVIKISGVTNSGNISGLDYAGGIAGITGGSKADGNKDQAKYVNCKNTGNVSAKTAGGVAGKLQGALLDNCSGGGASSKIAGSVYKGRIAGECTTNADFNAELKINDANGDDYADLLTIGMMSRSTSWALVTVSAGTFHGKPYMQGNTSKITIVSPGAWDAYPGETGTWTGTQSTSEWTKE